VTEPVTTALCHFAFARFTQEYWALDENERADRVDLWLADLERGARVVDTYRIFPAATDADVCVWSSVEADRPDAAALFFEAFARACTPMRRFAEFTGTLWGYAKRSQYSSATRSVQALDPFATERPRYLVVYPFVKTSAWYRKSREERQRIMNEHMRIGKQYPDISQLLLYSFGLQDQEFVPVYAMDRLERFSELVAELRGTEGRPYTERDWPVRVGWRTTAGLFGEYRIQFSGTGDASR